MNFKCEICEEDGTRYKRCDEHYRCDDCLGTSDLCFYAEGLLCDSCHRKRVEKRIAAFSEDTLYTSEIVCPRCGYRIGDSWEYANDDDGEIECSDCGIEFVYEAHQSYSFSTREADH